MKKNLFKLLFVMLFLLTISFTIVFKNSNFAEADEIIKTEEVVEPSLNIYKKNISYSSEIYVMYAVSYEGIDVTTNPVKMLFYNSVQDEYTTQTAAYIASSKGGTIIDNETCQIFSSNGLAAKQMTDDIYARAYVEVEGQTIYSEVVKYSVLEYYYEIKEAGTVSANILNLLEAMVNYGAAAQINFNYNTEKLANATYYKVNVENTVLPDGFTSGRFKAEEQISLTAFEKEGYVFTGWTNANGDVVSTELTYTLTVTQDETLTANYEEEAGVILTLAKEAAYDATASTLDLPTTVTFDYNNETVTENVTWDTTPFVVNKIGKQKLYGTLSNDSYKVNELSIEIDVLPYTFSLNEETNEYSITKYYGTSEEETIPETFNNVSIVELKQYAFENVLTIKNLIIPTTINKIEQSAIYGCNSLERITIPFIGDSLNSTKTFGYIFGATSYSNHTNYIPKSLTNIILQEGTKKISDYAFYYCNNLKSLELPSSLVKIGGSAFFSCYMFSHVYYNGTIETWCNIDFGFNDGSNPMTYAEHFYLKNNDVWCEVFEINIPNTITKIGQYQFCGFDNITSVKLSTNITTIGYQAFKNCSNLVSINVPENVTSIGQSFVNCSNLSEIYYEGDIESWCNIKFNDWKDNPMLYAEKFYMKGLNCDWNEVTEIIIPDSVTVIGSNQFCGFDNVLNIVISNYTVCVEENAFYKCSSLTNVYYEGTIESWCNISFEVSGSNPMWFAEHFYMKNKEGNWYEVTEIEIPNTITQIGDDQFSGFENVTSITIPEGVTSIGSSAFYGCSSLTSINIPEGVTSIGSSTFYGCSSLTSINIPKSVTSIGDSAFYGCSSLTSINIPEGVTSIGSSAFYNCSNLTSITIPSGVTSIGNNAFNGCTNLKTVYNLSDLELTIGSTDYGYVAYYAEVIYTTLPEE